MDKNFLLHLGIQASTDLLKLKASQQEDSAEEEYLECYLETLNNMMKIYEG